MTAIDHLRAAPACAKCLAYGGDLAVATVDCCDPCALACVAAVRDAIVPAEPTEEMMVAEAQAPLGQKARAVLRVLRGEAGK